MELGYSVSAIIMSLNCAFQVICFWKQYFAHRNSQQAQKGPKMRIRHIFLFLLSLVTHFFSDKRKLFVHRFYDFYSQYSKRENFDLPLGDISAFGVSFLHQELFLSNSISLVSLLLFKHGMIRNFCHRPFMHVFHSPNYQLNFPNPKGINPSPREGY